MNRKTLKTILLLIALVPILAHSQEVALKTNLLYAATTTPNLSLEWAPTHKISIDLQGSYNDWHFGKSERNRKIKHWFIQPEVRFWIYEAFDGHFLGIHPFYGQFNAGNIHLPLRIWQGLKDHRYEGYATGLGFSYGYQWYLGHHWNLEFEFGFGYAYLNYDKYEYPKCGANLGNDHKHYFGPTKLGISIVYLFKSPKR
ncbi:MAG: DUF3575 domain-containing protein [Tannerellaceae bacterium]|nr:DUF3575 domain-containing protein [Tannerellaceae bacterium]MCD8178888.1 DUF3575 domain-containing protein [Tannerellaceae bacterium]